MTERDVTEHARAGERPAPTKRPSRTGHPLGGLELLTVALLALLLGQQWITELFVDAPAVQTFATIFVSICIQALPFLVLGVVLSAFLTAYVPPSFFAPVLPRHPGLAVPVADRILGPRGRHPNG